MFQSLWLEADPKLPQNKYYPPYMMSRLLWLYTNAYTVRQPIMPPGWDQPQFSNVFATLAAASYCSVATLKVFDAPCVIAYPNMLMISLRFEYPMLLKPDREFRNDFALSMGHEAIHLEREKSFFTPNIPYEQRAAEETRTWLKTIRDMAKPLEDKGQPVGAMFLTIEKHLKPCGYKLPCKEFQDYVRDNLTSKN